MAKNGAKVAKNGTSTLHVFTTSNVRLVDFFLDTFHNVSWTRETVCILSNFDLSIKIINPNMRVGAFVISRP